MNKLQVFWKSRLIWSYSFFYWKCFMFPHLYEKLPKYIPELWDGYWFWRSLNFSDKIFDEELCLTK